MAITKSISRFARNTLDALNYIRKLKALNIPIIFEKESVNTLEASGELMVTILASIAQQESASISQNVRMGINFGFQEGRGRVNFSSFLGYRRGDKAGTYEIVPAEADVVRRIYRQFLEGYSPKMIADGLMVDGICTPSGGEKWYPSTVASILENEKYAGDLLMQKWYVEDYLTHKCVATGRSILWKTITTPSCRRRCSTRCRARRSGGAVWLRTRVSSGSGTGWH